MLLHLAGGPVAPTSEPCVWTLGCEPDFIVVTWDQRGSGQVVRGPDPTETLTLDPMVADTGTHDYLMDRFDGRST